MQTPYISAIYPLPGPDETRPVAQFLSETGQNTGNLIFSAAVLRLVRGLARPPREITDLGEIAEACDGVVLAAANWLQPARDLGEMAALVEQMDKPTVVLGLGAQAQEDRIPELPRGSLRFLSAVSERSASISVRGTFSAEVLDHYGIHNVTVTGCPSLLYHLDRPAQIAPLAPPDPDRPLRLGLNGGLPGDRIPARDSPRHVLGRFMLGEARRLGADYTAQTELPLMRLARGALPPEDPAWPLLSQALGEADRARLAGWAAAHVKLFGRAEDWIAWAASRDLVIGTRLHGVIAALLAGRPAILLTHDSRTAEMARQAGIPARPAAQALDAGALDPARLLAECDPAPFNARQPAYLAGFAAFLDRNGVPHRLTPPAGPCH